MMMSKRLKVLMFLCLLLIITGCEKKQPNIINKKPALSFEDNQTIDTYQITQLSNGTYIYRDRQYPGLD